MPEEKVTLTLGDLTEMIIDLKRYGRLEDLEDEVYLNLALLLPDGYDPDYTPTNIFGHAAFIATQIGGERAEATAATFRKAIELLSKKEHFLSCLDKNDRDALENTPLPNKLQQVVSETYTEFDRECEEALQEFEALSTLFSEYIIEKYNICIRYDSDFRGLCELFNMLGGQELVEAYHNGVPLEDILARKRG